jgi:hypothetical protein
MRAAGLTPGDVVTATILAADDRSTPEAVIADARRRGFPLVDEANARAMHAWPLEILMGLVYLDYADDSMAKLGWKP